MLEEKTSVFSNGLIWFGAAVSIAEIFAGTLIAPLGFVKGIFAVVLGHLIGCVLLYFAGRIGALTEKSAMETVKRSFGQKGSILFSSLNILQLVGWTAVMIFSGAMAAKTIADFGGIFGWSIVLGALIVLWLVVGIKNLHYLNVVAMGALFILTIILCKVVFGSHSAVEAGGEMSFGAAVELSAAMPLSWLVLISDYTRSAKRKLAVPLVSAGVYFFASCWMYIIGLGAALFTGESDIAKIMLSAGLGLVGLLIILFSTVTTTFLDAYSAGVSAVSILAKSNEKWIAIGVCILGTILAIFTPITQFESFLYLIGSVFAPMVAIQITDFYILKNNYAKKAVHLPNLIVWATGFVLYRLCMQMDTPIGSTLPVMVVTSILCIIINQFLGGKKNARALFGKRKSQKSTCTQHHKCGHGQ